MTFSLLSLQTGNTNDIASVIEFSLSVDSLATILKTKAVAKGFRSRAKREERLLGYPTSLPLVLSYSSNGTQLNIRPG